jgi:hypothetical protein
VKHIIKDIFGYLVVKKEATPSEGLLYYYYYSFFLEREYNKNYKGKKGHRGQK